MSGAPNATVYPELIYLAHAWLRANTWLGASSGREEKAKGSLKVGKLADLAILDRDVRDLAGDDIQHLRIDTTIVGGEVKFRGGH